MKTPPPFAAMTAVCLGAVIATKPALAADIAVMTNGAVQPILVDLSAPFERASGHKVKVTVFGTVAVVNRITKGAPSDLIVLNRPRIDQLANSGNIVSGSIANIFRSRLGIAVRAGTSKPDLSSVEALRRTLLNAKSIVYSNDPSGVYFTNELVLRLGIADRLKPRIAPAKGASVGSLVAKGEAEIGFHQMAELLPIKGIEIVELPAGMQPIINYAAGVHSSAQHPDAALALARFMLLETSAPAIRKNGMEPIPR